MESNIAMTNDAGGSWQYANLPAPKATIEEIKCAPSDCYALAVDETSTHVFHTRAGRNAWALVASLERSGIARVMSEAGVLPAAVQDFVVCGLLPSASELEFVGFGSSANYSEEWTASLSLKPGASPASFRAFDTGTIGRGRDDVCLIQKAPDGSTWAAGKGAFRLESGAWQKVWTYPGPNTPPQQRLRQ